MSQKIGDLLIAELANTDFDSDSLLVKLVGSRIGDRGEHEIHQLPQDLRYGNVLRATCMRHLGIGASLTEFLIASLPLSLASRRNIASIGGIAHTIYAVFDSLLDVSKCAPELFGEAPDFAEDEELRNKQQIVVRLVSLYFEKLRSFSSANKEIQSLTERAIRKLHQAELESAKPGDITRHAWWGKNALPIIVMGLPAWLLSTGESNISFTEHMLWLGRVGEFLGWVDDFADYEKDYASGQANRLNSVDRTCFQLFARKVSAKGKRVLERWDCRNKDPVLRSTFTVMVWTSLNMPEVVSGSLPQAAGSGASGR